MNSTVAPSILAVVALSCAACGGSDEAGDGDASAETTAAGHDAGEDSGGEGAGASGGLDAARDSPCDVIPVSVVDEVLGSSYTATPDEFGELVCQYSGEVDFGIAWGPGFAGSVESNFERGEGDAIQIEGLGDFAYRYLNLELSFALNGDAISLQGGLDMETQGVALAEAIIAELEGS